MKRYVPLLVSAVILVFIYWRIDTSALFTAIRTASYPLLLLGIFLYAPMILLQSWRLVLMAPRRDALSVWESVKIRLATAVVDLTMPSGSGIVGKAWFLTRRGHMSASFAGSLVLFEKMADVLAMAFWCSLGFALSREVREAHGSLTIIVFSIFTGLLLLMTSRHVATSACKGVRKLLPRKKHAHVDDAENSWLETQRYFWSHPGRLAATMGFSLASWFIQVSQIHIYARALGADAPFAASLGLGALALFAGFMPFTLGGIGARDAALIVLYKSYIDPPTGAALGILTTLRLVAPAIFGIPFLHEVTRAKEAADGNS